MKELLKDNWTMLKETLIETGAMAIYVLVFILLIVILILPAAVLVAVYDRKNKRNK